MTSKWNGKSLYRLTQKKQRITSLDTAIGELNQLRSEADREYVEELGRIIERDPLNIQTGSWSCEESPIKLCVYDMSTDGQDNECLFCDGPNERK